MMNTQRNLAVAMLALGLSPCCALATPGDKSAVTYRWVDEKGEVHYGDRVPPQYVQKESAILNSQGVQVGRLEAQKTPEQLAEDARRQQEALRQKQHDSFLVTTYSSVADIERLRDERLDTIDAQRQAAEQYVENLHSRLSLLQTRALLFKPYNPRPEARRLPDDLAEDLVRTLNEMRTQRRALLAKDDEQATLRKQFQGDIERYKELRTARTSR
jgi:hypothetical protein